MNVSPCPVARNEPKWSRYTRIFKIWGQNTRIEKDGKCSLQLKSVKGVKVLFVKPSRRCLLFVCFFLLKTPLFEMLLDFTHHTVTLLVSPLPLYQNFCFHCLSAYSARYVCAAFACCNTFNPLQSIKILHIKVSIRQTRLLPTSIYITRTHRGFNMQKRSTIFSMNKLRGI